jgi:class 3 adenylate cyclase
MAGLLVFQGLRAERNARQVLDRQHELEAQSRAFSELSSKAALFDAEDRESFGQLTEIVSDAVNLRRTSLWRFDDDGRFLTCIDTYDYESNGHTYGTALAREDFPGVYALLKNGEDINAPDVDTDSRLVELYRVYLQPMGCESLLAVPIRYHGQTVGALWFEHDRLHRGWSAEEISFAHSIADMLALRLSVDPTCIRAFSQPEEDTEAAETPRASSPQPALVASDIQPKDHPIAPDIAPQRSSPNSIGRKAPITSFLDRLKAGGIDPDQTAADIYTNSTVLVLRFTDPLFLAGRIADSEATTAIDLVVSYMEELAASHDIDYMKIVGEEIICAAGINTDSKDHAPRIADLALTLQNRCTGLFASQNAPMEFRIGIDTGAVMGSSVGLKQKSYNIWGESVRFASKMAESSLPGGIQVSQTTYQHLRANYMFQVRGRYYLPKIGETSTYNLTGRI